MQGSFTRDDEAIREIVQSVRFGATIGGGDGNAEGEESAESGGVEADGEGGGEGGSEGGSEGGGGKGRKPARTDLLAKARAEAQKLDKEYARLVVGHAKVLDMSKAWASEHPSTTTLDQSMFTKLLAEILDRVSARELQQLSAQNKRVKKISQTVRRVQELLREAWDEFDVYSVGSKITSAEDDIIEDLLAAGYFPFLNNSFDTGNNMRGHKQRNKLRFVCRRAYSLQAAFARVVGCKILTEEIVAMSRSSIIEHNRSSVFYQEAAVKFSKVVRANGEEIQKIVLDEDTTASLTLDYREMNHLATQKLRDEGESNADLLINTDESAVEQLKPK